MDIVLPTKNIQPKVRGKHNYEFEVFPIRKPYTESYRTIFD